MTGGGMKVDHYKSLISFKININEDPALAAGTLGNLPDSDGTVRVSSVDCLSVSGPGQGEIVVGLSVLARCILHNIRLQLINNE